MKYIIVIGAALLLGQLYMSIHSPATPQQYMSTKTLIKKYPQLAYMAQKQIKNSSLTDFQAWHFQTYINFYIKEQQKNQIQEKFQLTQLIHYAKYRLFIAFTAILMMFGFYYRRRWLV